MIFCFLRIGQENDMMCNEVETMFVEERQTHILNELQQNGKVRVKDLSEKFQVTEDLIRKDLHTLEEAGKLKRIYGGAILIKQNVHREVAAQRKNINMESKKKIAQKAYSLIRPGTIIFLDISTSNIQLAQLIAKNNLPVTVVSNMIEVISTLAHSNVNVIAIGGELDFGRDGMIGPLAYEMLKSFRFDQAFVGVVGVNLDDNEVTTYMANEGLTKQLIVKNSKEVYMMCEVEKLNEEGNYQFATVDDFTGCICGKTISEQRKKQFHELNVEVFD